MINRDGACTSLWQNSVNPYTSNHSEPTTDVDVIVAGGGITGITTALLLQEAGKNCLVLEANTLCFGTTAGTTAHLNTLLDTPYTTISKNFGKENARLVAEATRMAIAHIRENISRYNIDCDFEEAEAFLFAQEKKQEEELEKILEATVDAGLNASYVTNIPVPIPFTKAIRVQEQAKFNPVRYVYALAAAFENAGGIIKEHCAVTGAEETGTVEVQTTQGKFTARSLIYATHIPTGVNLLHLRCVPYRSYAMAIKLDDKKYPDDLIYDMYDPYHYYRTQIIDGEKYFIAGGEDHKTGHVENTEYCFLRLESYLRQFFGIKEIKYKWSSQYFEPDDGLPYIGHLPGHPGNIYVAAGYGGNGMVYSQVAALTLKKILLNEESPYINLFNPNRVKPVAGFKTFITHNADVVKQFVGKLFSGEQLSELADLAPGEAKVVKYEKHKIALHKDEAGALHAVNPGCTHLQCEVKWNNAEQTWDCPCHGARYNANGEVVTAPADRNLEKIDITEEHAEISDRKKG